MNRCVIIGGAKITKYDFVKSYLDPEDYYIFCDSGLYHMDKLSVNPNLVIGDFDSHQRPDFPVETITLPCVKDDTDTVFAVKEALVRGFDEFLLVGAVGGRLDHTIGNLSILLKLHSLGKKARIIDDFSSMEIVDKTPVSIKDDCAFFSLLNISGTSRGITVTNAKYPLYDSEITCLYQYGVSNEVLPGKTAVVSVNEGNLLLIRVYRDDEKN